jgi:hypothetical protein
VGWNPQNSLDACKSAGRQNDGSGVDIVGRLRATGRHRMPNTELRMGAIIKLLPEICVIARSVQAAMKAAG